MTMSASPDFSAGGRGRGTDDETLNEVKDCVVGWLQNDRQHVTLRTVQLEYDFISRREASLVLELASKEILSKQEKETTTDHGLEITRIKMVPSSRHDNGSRSPTSVLRLSKSIAMTLESTQFPKDFSEGSIYSVCPLAPATADDGNTSQRRALYSVQNAHESDMVKLQDAYKNKTMPPINGSSGPTIRPSSLLLAELSSTKENASPIKPTGGGLYNPSRSTAASRLQNKQQSNMVKALQPTQPPKQKTKSSAAQEAPSFTSSASTTLKPTTASKFFANNQNKKNQRSSKKKATEDEKKKEEKKSKEIGNADDFVGDEESEDDEKDQDDDKKAAEEEMETDIVEMGGGSEDDDEVIEERKGKKGTAKGGRRATKEKKRNSDEEVDDESPEEPVKGAMDAFASVITKKHSSPSSQKESSSSGKRRRRVTKEETFMTEDGYIKTQTVSVWEDIPTDEEEEIEKKLKLASSASSSTTSAKQPKAFSNASTASKSKSSANTAGGKKKQLGLNAFFSKKK